MPFTTSTYLVSDVANDVKRTFGDETGIQITDNDIIRWINRAHLELYTSLSINRATATADLVANQNVYDVANLNILKIQSIHILNKQIKFLTFQESEKYILDGDPSGGHAVGIPQIWTEWAGKVHLFPAPDNLYEDGMIIYYLPYPEKVTQVTDYLKVPDKYYNRVVDYVQAQAHELDEDQQSAQYKLGQFTTGVNSLNEDENIPHIDYYPTILVLPEDE